MTTKPIEEQARILSNRQVAGTLFIIELESPHIARELCPGQFVHMQVPGMPEKILRRPFSVYKTNPARGCLTILYQVVGAGTDVLSGAASGASCSLIGPIGNTWAPPAGAQALLVGGGVGAAPLFMLATQLAQIATSLHVVLGAQTKEALVCYEDYRSLPSAELSVATDDGSFGHAGFCTQPAYEIMQTGAIDYVAVCGPEPLMKIVSSHAQDAGIFCEVSLERRMACGVGACLSCVVDTTAGKKRCCVDGPIFDARKVVW